MAYLESDDSLNVGDRVLGQIIKVPRLGGVATVVGSGFDNISGLLFDSNGGGPGMTLLDGGELAAAAGDVDGHNIISEYWFPLARIIT